MPSLPDTQIFGWIFSYFSERKKCQIISKIRRGFNPCLEKLKKSSELVGGANKQQTQKHPTRKFVIVWLEIWHFSSALKNCGKIPAPLPTLTHNPGWIGIVVAVWLNGSPSAPKPPPHTPLFAGLALHLIWHQLARSWEEIYIFLYQRSNASWKNIMISNPSTSI